MIVILMRPGRNAKPKAMNPRIAEQERFAKQRAKGKVLNENYQLLEAKLKKAKNISETKGITIADIRERAKKFEEIAREQKRFGGQIDTEIMEEIEHMRELLGEGSPEFMSLKQINDAIRAEKDPRKKEAFLREKIRRESAI